MAQQKSGTRPRRTKSRAQKSRSKKGSESKSSPVEFATTLNPSDATKFRLVLAEERNVSLELELRQRDRLELVAQIGRKYGQEGYRLVHIDADKSLVTFVTEKEWQRRVEEAQKKSNGAAGK